MNCELQREATDTSNSKKTKAMVIFLGQFAIIIVTGRQLGGVWAANIFLLWQCSADDMSGGQ